jgi:hypothetical protein
MRWFEKFGDLGMIEYLVLKIQMMEIFFFCGDGDGEESPPKEYI